MAGHELGYLTDSTDATVSHAYFGALGPVIVLALCAAAWSSALRVLRRDAGRTPSLALLAGLQAALFAAMEIGERVTTDSAGSLLSVPVMLGLVVQPIVAWAALRLLATSRHIIEALFAPDAPALDPASLPASHWRIDACVDLVIGNRLRVRGPPMA